MSVVADQQPKRVGRIGRGVAVLFLLLVLIGTILVLQPFITALTWAAVLSFVIWPVHRHVVALLGGRNALAAFLMTALMAGVLVVPLLLAVLNLRDDAVALAHASYRFFEGGLPPTPEWVHRVPVLGPRATNLWAGLSAEVANLMHASGGSTQPTTATAETTQQAAAAGSFVAALKVAIIATSVAIGEGLMQITLSLLFTFFLLKDGAAVAARVSTLASRVSAQRGVEMLHVAGGTVRGVVYGILGTALVQAILAGIGFAIAGVPGATLLGLLTFAVSPLPFGPPLVWIPATIWLFATGQRGMAVFMAAFGLIISSVDNFIKPLIISRGSDLPFVLILIGVLGGAFAFGLIGVFIGPTLLAVAYKLIEVWSRIETLPATADEPFAGATSKLS